MGPAPSHCLLTRPSQGPKPRRAGADRRRWALPLTITLLPLSLAGCLGPLPSTPLLLTGNLAAPVVQGLGCPRLSELKGRQPPQQLYRSMAACLRRSDPDTAVVLFSLAAAYGRYDALRVADPSAHQASTVLRLMALRNLNGAERQVLSQGIAAALAEPGGRPDLCAAVERIGPPRYSPDYMLRHGLVGFHRRRHGAAPSAPTDAALTHGFDGDAAWNRVLDTVLRCSKV